jgi:outer membrane protein
MKNKMMIVLAMALIMFGSSANAQVKIGYINTQQLFEIMPEAKVIDSVLNDFAQKLKMQQDAMVQELNSKMSKFEADRKSGDMAQSVLEVRYGEIEDLQTRIQNFQQKAQQDLTAKQQELYKPLIDKIENAIKEVAKENGFRYVFESSTGNILYSVDEDNILPLVKKKLGIE